MQQGPCEHLVEGGVIENVLHVALAVEGHQRANLQLIVCACMMRQSRVVKPTQERRCTTRVDAVHIALPRGLVQKVVTATRSTYEPAAGAGSAALPAQAGVRHRVGSRLQAGAHLGRPG